MKSVHKGDDTFTDIKYGRVPKDSPVIEMIGQIDELVAVLGIVRSVLSSDPRLGDLEKRIGEHQRYLLRIASYIAYGGRDVAKSPITPEVLRSMEEEIRKLWERLPQLGGFIVPSGPLPATLINLARAICRRVERYASRLAREGYIEKPVYMYMNRLSDLLFVYLRYVMQVLEASEEYL